MLKSVSMKKMRAIIHEKHIDDTIRTLGELGALHLINIKDKIEKTEGKIKPVEPSERYYKISSLLSRVEHLINNLQIKKIIATKKANVPKFPPDTFLEKMEKEIKQIEEQYTKLTQEIKSLKEEGELEGKNRIKDLEEKLQKLSERNTSKLLAFHEVLEIEKRIEEAKTLMGKTETTYILEGWIPTKEVEKVTKTLLNASKGTAFIEILDEEGHHEEEEETPTLLKNPKIVEPFETLTKTFGIPTYGELDPTILMSMTFPIIFGLMFGDIGHGLLLLLASILGLIAKRKKMNLGEMANYIIEGSPLLLLCGIFSIFFGLLYAEFFGIAIYHDHWYAYGIGPLLLPFRNILISLFTIFDFKTGKAILSNPNYPEYIPPPPEGPVWFSPNHAPFILFVLAIIVGIIHLALGLFLNIVNKLMHKEYEEAILGPGMWLWFYIGVMLITFDKGMAFMEWFEGINPLQPAQMVTNRVFLLLILPLILMFAGRITMEGLSEGILGTIESLIESISNTVSYARILALNMAHVGFSKTFILLGGADPEHGFATLHITPAFIASLVAGTILIMIIEGLLAFIHALRLHWLEWFSKFYKGEGIEFQPFKIERYYTITR